MGFKGTGAKMGGLWKETWLFSKFLSRTLTPPQIYAVLRICDGHLLPGATGFNANFLQCIYSCSDVGEWTGSKIPPDSEPEEAIVPSLISDSVLSKRIATRSPHSLTLSWNGTFSNSIGLAHSLGLSISAAIFNVYRCLWYFWTFPNQELKTFIWPTWLLDTISDTSHISILNPCAGMRSWVVSNDVCLEWLRWCGRQLNFQIYFHLSTFRPINIAGKDHRG